MGCFIRHCRQLDGDGQRTSPEFPLFCVRFGVGGTEDDDVFTVEVSRLTSVEIVKSVAKIAFSTNLVLAAATMYRSRKWALG
jgi:hypothetical protein